MIPKSIQNHCRKNGITVDLQGSDVTFIAPAGKVFSTDAGSRTFEDYDYMSARELIGYLDVQPRRHWT